MANKKNAKERAKGLFSGKDDDSSTREGAPSSKGDSGSRDLTGKSKDYEDGYCDGYMDGIRDSTRKERAKTQERFNQIQEQMAQNQKVINPAMYTAFAHQTGQTSQPKQKFSHGRAEKVEAEEVD